MVQKLKAQRAPILPTPEANAACEQAVFRIESALKALHALRQQGDRSVRGARLLGITWEESDSSRVDNQTTVGNVDGNENEDGNNPDNKGTADDDSTRNRSPSTGLPPQAVRDAVRIAAKHAALCRVVFLVTESKKTLVAARAQRSILSSGVDGAAGFLEELIQEMWGETIAASLKPWANGVGSVARRTERGDANDPDERLNEFEHVSEGNTRGGRGGGRSGRLGGPRSTDGNADTDDENASTRKKRVAIADPTPGSPDSRAARAEGDSEGNHPSDSNGGAGSLLSLGGGSIADGPVVSSGDEAGGGACVSRGGTHTPRVVYNTDRDHRYDANNDETETALALEIGTSATPPASQAGSERGGDLEGTPAASEGDSGAIGVDRRGVSSTGRLERRSNSGDDGGVSGGGGSTAGDWGGDTGATTSGSRGGDEDRRGCESDVNHRTSSQVHHTSSEVQHGYESKVRHTSSEVHHTSGEEYVTHHQTHVDAGGSGIHGGGGEGDDEANEITTNEGDHRMGNSRHVTPPAHPTGSFSGVISGVTGGGSGGHGTTVSSGFAGPSCEVHHRDNVGEHRGRRDGSASSSHRLHKSVRFATTIDDGGQRTGTRGRYSPPPSPPRSGLGLGLGSGHPHRTPSREQREDTPPGHVSRGLREDTPPAPGGNSVDSHGGISGDPVLLGGLQNILTDNDVGDDDLTLPNETQLAALRAMGETRHVAPDGFSGLIHAPVGGIRVDSEIEEPVLVAKSVLGKRAGDGLDDANGAGAGPSKRTGRNASPPPPV